jgi:hypothetical protein
MDAPASISIAAIPARIDACELCSTPNEPLRAALTVRHVRGGATSFAICQRCATALRRVIAAAGGAAAGSPASIVPAPPPVADTSPDLVGAPTLVLEFAETVRASTGLTYVVRVWAQGRTDGTWIGWIAFVPLGGGAVHVTPPETSQSSLADVTYWASGLQASFLEGAFQRAQVR